MGPPPKPSEAGSVGRGGTAEGMSFRVYAEANGPQLGPTMWGATTRRAVRRGDLWSPDVYRGRPLAGRACPAGAPISSRRNGGKEGAGGVPPAPPSTGGSWRRWVVIGPQRPAAHCRKFSWRFCHRRCRALGGTHRDCLAGPDNGCAVPAWPAGPPSVPCPRKTRALAAAFERRRRYEVSLRRR